MSSLCVCVFYPFLVCFYNDACMLCVLLLLFFSFTVGNTDRCMPRNIYWQFTIPGRKTRTDMTFIVISFHYYQVRKSSKYYTPYRVRLSKNEWISARGLHAKKMSECHSLFLTVLREQVGIKTFMHGTTYP